MANKPVKNRRKRDGAQSEFKEELIDLARVTRVVKGGRRMRFRATVVAGNEKGKVGLGIGKANEVTIAIKKAIVSAKKNMKILPLKNGTIDRDIKVKFKGAQILLMPACEGTGVIAGGSVRKIAEVAGVHNLLSKRFGSTNKLTNAQAMMKAIEILATANRPKEEESEVVKGENDKVQKVAKNDKKIVNKDEKKQIKGDSKSEKKTESA